MVNVFKSNKYWLRPLEISECHSLVKFTLAQEEFIDGMKKLAKENLLPLVHGASMLFVA